MHAKVHGEHQLTRNLMSINQLVETTEKGSMCWRISIINKQKTIKHARGALRTWRRHSSHTGNICHDVLSLFVYSLLPLSIVTDLQLINKYAKHGLCLLPYIFQAGWPNQKAIQYQFNEGTKASASTGSDETRRKQ